MIEKLKAYARSAGTTGAVVMVAGVVALPLQATAQDNPAATPAPAQGAVSATSSQIVVRDAATGQLRAPTAEEAQALNSQSSQGGQGAARQQRRASSAPSLPMPKAHADGARGARLTDEFMSYSVLVRQPDGRMAEVCFATKEEADAAVKTPPSVVKALNAPTE
jgi:hypothetical protein